MGNQHAIPRENGAHQDTMKLIKSLMAGLVGLVAPTIASAASTLNPPGGSFWQMTVYGNGQVVHDLMVGTAMIMKSPSFLVLTLFLAMTAFFIMAVNAGFDPGKNLLKMFGYIFVVFGVSLGSNLDDRGIVMNVYINDKVNTNILLTYNPLVQEVPVLIAFPAVLTSEIGRFFTEQFETNFLNPAGFDPAIFGLTGGAAGQFNLFNRMMTDAQEFRITNPELQRSVSAYMADCTIPAIARGALSMKELNESTNLNATLSKATHKAIMTRYYFTDVPAVQEVLSSGASLSSETRSALGSAAGGTLAGAAGNGIVMPCEDAYNTMQAQMTSHASFLLNAAGDAWRKSGVQVPFATAMDSMLQSAGASSGATPGSPANFIKQQAYLNQMDPAMRTAAAQTGNNVLLQSAAIAQAEQSQKSSWVSGFALFNNMMGYVFTVLQAFIFAVTPMIVVALLVPGFGTAIFKNYAQILLWLTLWEPMLALINYLITSFSIASTATSLVSTSGTGPLVEGFNKASNWVMSERTNTLTIAAQFLGTMVPMITWGIVKGAMAFTEFISHGIGSSFANTAGAAAATGSLSWNNSQMNNFSANKFNGAMSSGVGYQETSAFYGAGAGSGLYQAGGASASANGGAIGNSKEAAAQTSLARAESQKISEALSKAMANSSNISEVKANLASLLTGSSLAKAHNIVDQHGTNKAESGKDTANAQRQASLGDKAATGADANAANKAALDVKGGTPGAGLLNVGVSGGVGTENRTGTNAEVGKDANRNQSTSVGVGKDVVASVSDGHNESASTIRNRTDSASAGKTHTKSEQESWSETKSRIQNAANEITRTLTVAESFANKQSGNSAVDMTRANNIMAAISAYEQVMNQRGASLEAANSALDNIKSMTGDLTQTPKGITEAAGVRMDTPIAQQAAADPEMARLAAERKAAAGQATKFAPSDQAMNSVIPVNHKETVEGMIASSEQAVQGQQRSLDKDIKKVEKKATDEVSQNVVASMVQRGADALGVKPDANASNYVSRRDQ